MIDHSAGDRTTSEGESYAMFFALVDDDRTRFDKLLNWTEANLAGGDLTERLPAWEWGKSPAGEWKVLDQHPAADADLWLAYSLLEAGRLWREPRYNKLGSALLTRIELEEVTIVPGLGVTLIAGAQGFHPDLNTWILNPSYLPLPLLLRMAQVDPQGPWNGVIKSLTPLLTQGSGSGFAMDWVLASDGIKPMETPSQFAAGLKDAPALGSYDAIRVYLWLGITDSATPGIKPLLGDLDGMANYMKDQSSPPASVDSSGKVLDSKGSAGFSAAVIPFLLARGMKVQAKQQMDRVAAQKDAVTGLVGHGEYYDQNLALFGTGWSEQRFRFDRNGMLKLKWK